MRPSPKVGETYFVGHGQGWGRVLKVEVDDSGTWRRVLVRICTGCCPMPPPDRPTAPEEEWRIPHDDLWIDRSEWQRTKPAKI